MLVVSETSLGTPETTWLRSPELVDLPEMDWGLPGRVVVISPHPDDETLAVGGTMSLLVRRGFTVDVIAVTDGEASHPRSPSTSRRTLARLREEEQTRALSVLGLPRAAHRLHIRDGRVRDAQRLANELAKLLCGADWCLAPFVADGHPDHDAAGLAASIACARTQVPFAMFPVWAWHWATPDELPLCKASAITLDADAHAAKARAIACFTSQLAPLSSRPGDERVLPPGVVARFARPFETVFTW